MLGFVLPSRWGCAMYRRKPCWTSGPLKLPHSFHKQIQPRQEGHDLLLPVLQFLHPLPSQIVSSTASRCTDRPLHLALPWPFLLSEHYKQIKTFYRKKILKTEIISVWILAMKESTTCVSFQPHISAAYTSYILVLSSSQVVVFLSYCTWKGECIHFVLTWALHYVNVTNVTIQLKQERIWTLK